MHISEHEKPLAEWLEANYPEVLEDYRTHLGADLGEIYFLDLRGWLHREHADVLTEHDLERYHESRESLY
jgi:hypothetical protein